MNALRIASKHTRSLSQKFRVNPPQTRSFYSPFAVLSQNSPSSSSTKPSYEKPTHDDFEVEHGAGTVYVVSEPDPSDRPYAVPAGAYPTSLPYVNFTQTEAPDASGAKVSSTSPDLARPNLTRRVPTNKAGVGESAAVRNSDAPGEMGTRGGGHGGLGLMDESSTEEGEGQLGSRNPPPVGDVAEKYSKLGVQEAWKARK